jgi:ribosomal protein S17E
MMHFWVEEDDNYDDFEDNLKLVTNICGFSQKEVRLMESYLEKYKELKDIQ